MLHIRVALVIGLGALCATTLGCQKEGCVGGEEGCRVASPCQNVTFTCDGDTLELKRIAQGDATPGGLDALGAVGDVLLQNGHVSAVIADIGNQNGVDPNGGTIIDLASTGKDNDSINVIAQTTGLLPRDALHYTKLELIDERPTRVAVQVTGTLDGYPGVAIYTLYELRPCDRGVRIRTEAVNGWTQPQTWALSDVFYWQDREPISFSPGPDMGYHHPGLALTTANDSYRAFPFMAGASQTAPYASYAHVACNVPTMEGLNNDFISLSGLPRRIVQPRDYQILERFMVVEDGRDIAAAAGTAMEIRHQAFGEEYVTVSGTVERVGALALDTPRETNVLLFEGTLDTPAEKRVPWTQAVPDASGKWTAKVPKGKDYLLQIYSFGQKKIEEDLGRIDGDKDIGKKVLPSTARVTVHVNDGPGASPTTAEVFVVPQDPAKAEQYRGTFNGHEWVSNSTQCAPWLGPEFSGSPACNRILVENGSVTVEVPMGDFYFYAFKGPFWTIERKAVTLTDGDVTLDFTLEKLPLQPAQTVTADLHVHSGISFDSSLPQRDRVMAFAATDLQVIVASEHDVAWDFQKTIEALGFSSTMTSIPGVETTAQIPFLAVPGDGFPRVIGHYIFFPIQVDLDKPRNGAPFDDLIEPGILFDRVKPLFTGDTKGVRLLPHPWGGPYFGRDTGWPRAIHLDLKKDLPQSDDGTRMGLYMRTPGQTPNDGHDVQEVMNGTQNDSLLQYRAIWFYMLNQGKLRGGMANSDSHSLTDNTVGVPRNVVYTTTPAGIGFDVNLFDEAVRQGRSFGTNGPVIEAVMRGSTGPDIPYGLAPVKPPDGAQIHVKVSAAPWVNVKEVRFIVNGEVRKTISGAALAQPAEPFGTSGLLRYEGDVALSELLTGVSGDAWLVIEAGDPLPVAGDLGGGLGDGKGCAHGDPDGVPDTGDNNGDGKVDCADVKDADQNTNGPLNRPDTPTDEAHPNYHFSRVVSDGYPFAFTNPFVLDLNGNGTFDKPEVK